MNNIILGHDPLLYKYGSQPDNYQENLRKMEELMERYQSSRTEAMPADYLGELDETIKNSDPEVMEMLAENEEYVQLNGEIQAAIQNEIIKYVKTSINSNQDVVRRIQRVRDIIREAGQTKAQMEKQNMTELNDYIKNYSDMTFNEYKKMKNSAER